MLRSQNRHSKRAIYERRAFAQYRRATTDDEIRAAIRVVSDKSSDTMTIHNDRRSPVDANPKNMSRPSSSCARIKKSRHEDGHTSEPIARCKMSICDRVA
jgi:hypothetical protein